MKKCEELFYQIKDISYDIKTLAGVYQNGLNDDYTSFSRITSKIKKELFYAEFNYMRFIRFIKRNDCIDKLLECIQDSIECHGQEGDIDLAKRFVDEKEKLNNVIMGYVSNYRAVSILLDIKPIFDDNELILEKKFGNVEFKIDHRVNNLRVLDLTKRKPIALMSTFIASGFDTLYLINSDINYKYITDLNIKDLRIIYDDSGCSREDSVNHTVCFIENEEDLKDYTHILNGSIIIFNLKDGKMKMNKGDFRVL